MLNEVWFLQSFLFISRACLTIIILWNVSKIRSIKHRSTYAVFQLARKPSERINLLYEVLTLRNEKPAFIVSLCKCNAFSTVCRWLQAIKCSFRTVFIKLWAADRRWSAAGSKGTFIAKIVSDSLRAKNASTFVWWNCLLVDLEQKVGELVLSTTSCPANIILKNAWNWCIGKMCL
jgi:hypothetical protein